MRLPDEVAAPDQPGESERLTRLEQRLARIETHLGLSAAANPEAAVATQVNAARAEPAALAPLFDPSGPRSEEEFELEVGQNWFALAGIGVLTAGISFLVALPYRGVPALVPASGSLACAAALLILAQRGPRALKAVAMPLRGAAMALAAVATLRLFFFGQPALDIAGAAGRLVVCAALAAILAVAIRSRSAGLTIVALLIAPALTLAVGAAVFVLPITLGLAVLTTALVRRHGWPAVLLVGQAVAFVTYFLWAAGNPIRNGHLHFVAEPPWALPLLLALIAAWAHAPLRSAEPGDNPVNNVSALLNCTLGYGVLLLHTAAAFPRLFAGVHLVAALLQIGFGLVFFERTQSRVITFFHAMTGYAAHTAAIVKLAPSPAVFVWLSLQSVIVVATAIWFRSRFIVVANFFIFAAIVLAYVVVAERVSGISAGFALVALVSARILQWQQHRLELQTTLMRNAYLAGAFGLFPYALYHLVPAGYVAIAWVALAAGYYVLDRVMPHQKYRWLAHATLALTTLYVVSVGVSRFEPVYRVLSFLVLGTVLLAVSLARSRQRGRNE